MKLPTMFVHMSEQPPWLTEHSLKSVWKEPQRGCELDEVYLLFEALTYAVPEVGADHEASLTVAGEATVSVGTTLGTTAIIVGTLIQICVCGKVYIEKCE